MLCSVCKELLRGLKVTNLQNRELTHHQSLESLRDAVGTGCYTCNQVWNRCTDKTRSSSPSTLSSSFSFGRLKGEPDSVTLLVYFDEDIDIENCTTAGSSFTLMICPVDFATSLLQLTSDTKSDQTFDLAQKWITECVGKHSECNKLSSSKYWAPTRLLDCGTSEELSLCCRLIETNNSGEIGPYMTLSHCWGQVDCLKLTTDNRSQLMAGFPHSSLPVLYQDAIHATRRLGQRYLWIDSLCIIQKGDDSADWKREVAMMADVYSNSFCNIAALDAPDCNHSFFQVRVPDTLQPAIVDIPVDGKAIPYMVFDARFWENSLQSSLLNTRAWVMQERILSPRVLHFGTQLLWECRRKDAAEIYPRCLPEKLQLFHTRFKSLFSIEDASNHANREEKLYGIWNSILSAYSACNLTFATDKLPALSAVAQQMASALGDEYIAGMWRRNLEHDLLWSVTQPRDLRERPMTYRAPSWSWTAVDGRIQACPIERRLVLLSEVEGLYLEHGTEDIMSSVKFGSLRLWGSLKEVKVNRTSMGATASEAASDLDLSINNVCIKRNFVYLDALKPDYLERAKCNDLYCMPLAVVSGGHRQGDVHAMLLMEVLDRERSIFRRIGLIRATNFYPEPLWPILAHVDYEDKFPCHEYRGGRHLITII